MLAPLKRAVSTLPRRLILLRGEGEFGERVAHVDQQVIALFVRHDVAQRAQQTPQHPSCIPSGAGDTIGLNMVF